MKKALSISILLAIMLLPACAQQKTMKYTDDIFYKLAASPEEFQRTYGGNLEYYSPEGKPIGKDEADKKAYLKTDEFSISWIWEYDKYVPYLAKFTTNKVTIEGVKIIGKTKEQIIDMFGEPGEVYPSSIGYNGRSSYIAFSFKDNVVVNWSMGLR